MRVQTVHVRAADAALTDVQPNKRNPDMADQDYTTTRDFCAGFRCCVLAAAVLAATALDAAAQTGAGGGASPVSGWNFFICDGSVEQTQLTPIANYTVSVYPITGGFYFDTNGLFATTGALERACLSSSTNGVAMGVFVTNPSTGAFNQVFTPP
jgi:hypothetical protein